MYLRVLLLVRTDLNEKKRNPTSRLGARGGGGADVEATYHHRVAEPGPLANANLGREGGWRRGVSVLCACERLLLVEVKKEKERKGEEEKSYTPARTSE